MKREHEVGITGEAFAAAAQRRASELLVSTRLSGEIVRDEGDFLARATEQVYMDAGRERRARARRRGHS